MYGWALTIHFAQGKTFDCETVVDLSHIWDPGMGYVALSRNRRWSQLRLVNFNKDMTAAEANATVFKCHPGVRTFYEGLGYVYDGLSSDGVVFDRGVCVTCTPTELRPVDLTVDSSQEICDALGDDDNYCNYI